MIIYPAIDLKEGKCVRLEQGQFNKETVYSDNPVEMALNLEGLGAQYLHIVDLDGAKFGKPENLPLVREIADNVSIPLQLGGGIRDIKTIEIILSSGIRRVILGTSAVKDAHLVEESIKTFGESIAIGIDARDGMVAVEGWEKTSDFAAIDFAKKMEQLGAKTIIYTDISRDGMLLGPNLKAMDEMRKALNIEVIASGGVGKLEDIRNLKNIGMPGVIVGKAIYTGNLNIEEAIKAAM